MIFNISVTAINKEIHTLWPRLWEKYAPLVAWPSAAEWADMAGTWEDIPIAVGAIDGMSHEIYRPQIEPQELFYSGHRGYHCLHTDHC